MPRKSFQSALNRNGVEPVIVDIDGEEFVCSPVLPGATVLDLAAVAASGSNAERARAVMGILDAVMLPESAARFAERMRGGDRPITLEDAASVVTWLMSEVYLTARPTGGAAPSPSGS